MLQHQDTKAPRARWQSWLFVALLLAGAGLRLYHLGYRSLSTDEANVFWMARGSVDEIILHNAAGNSAPPLYALALNPLAEAHASEAALRSLSCAAGIAALAALYLLTSEYSGSAGALFAVFVAALAPSQVFYSQFLREYSLSVLCAALLLWAFTRFQRRPSWRSWAALTAIGVLAIAVQYGLALLVLALNVVFVLELRRTIERRPRVVWWTLAQAAMLGAAWVVYDQTLRHQLRPGGFGASYLGSGYWDGSAASLMRLVVGNTVELFAFAYPATVLLEGLVVLGIVELWRSANGRRAVLLLVTPILVVIATACLRLYPYLGARQSMMLTVMLYVCAASGFVRLRRVDWHGVGTALVIVWIGAEGVYGSYRTLMSTEPQHVRPIAEQLASEFRPGDRIYVYHRAVTPLLYYYPEESEHWIRGAYSPSDPAPHQRELAEALAQPGRVWVVFTMCEAGECETIRRSAAALRPIERVASDTGTELYRIDDPEQRNAAPRTAP